MIFGRILAFFWPCNELKGRFWSFLGVSRGFLVASMTPYVVLGRFYLISGVSLPFLTVFGRFWLILTHFR